MINDSEEMEANVRIWRVDCVWIVERVRAASEAEGKSARDGRMFVRVYEVPWVIVSFQLCISTSGKWSVRYGVLTVSRPRDIVPTNLVTVMGHAMMRQRDR